MRDFGMDMEAETDPRDMETMSMATCLNRIMIKVRREDYNDNTVEALRKLIPALREKGFTLVTVTQLFEKMGVKPEAHNGIIYTNAMQTK